MAISQKHHYVPQWYQKGFLEDCETNLHVLDKSPEQFPLPTGGYSTAKSVKHTGPGAVFFEKHLYTVRAFGKSNDDIERLLFGEIDTKGAAAVEAFLADDTDKLHDLYMALFEFFDALRLRTPKGLRWLKKIGETKSQIELMMVMQELRRMHCVMWGEGAIEIVSAKNSKRKFIFSDHPVTFFNPHVYPVGKSGAPAPDPEQQWIGTQTVFPLNRDNLLILTHVEGVKNVSPAHAIKPRTNARFFDSSIFMTDKCARGRELMDSQVAEVNYIIKQRADRYIAAGSLEDLYPEKFVKNRMWPKLGRFLLPPRSAASKAGGEIFVKSSDGSYMFQDAFGRRPQSQDEFAQKVAQAESLEAHFKRLLKQHHAELNSNEADQRKSENKETK